MREGMPFVPGYDMVGVVDKLGEGFALRGWEKPLPPSRSRVATPSISVCLLRSLFWFLRPWTRQRPLA